MHTYAWAQRQDSFTQSTHKVHLEITIQHLKTGVNKFPAADAPWNRQCLFPFPTLLFFKKLILFAKTTLFPSLFAPIPAGQLSHIWHKTANKPISCHPCAHFSPFSGLSLVVLKSPSRGTRFLAYSPLLRGLAPAPVILVLLPASRSCLFPVYIIHQTQNVHNVPAGYLRLSPVKFLINKPLTQ
jgi:hypothetical protein